MSRSTRKGLLLATTLAVAALAVLLVSRSSRDRSDEVAPSPALSPVVRSSAPAKPATLPVAQSLVSRFVAKSGFDPKDPRESVSRANEILAAARAELGIKPDLPLEAPLARGGEASAQVFYREHVGGLPLAPNGSVTVDLGPKGELLSISSDYHPNVTLSGTLKLDADTARGIALGGGSEQVEGGRLVAWVVGRLSRPGEPLQARRAYEFSVQGKQVVVDAENGAFLFSRDRRRF